MARGWGPNRSLPASVAPSTILAPDGPRAGDAPLTEHDLAGRAGRSRAGADPPLGADRGSPGGPPRRTAELAGEGLERLLDEQHAALVEGVMRLLRQRGWEVIPEASFSIRGERGSVDVLARWPANATVLVAEIKAAIGDVQMTLATLDRKSRLAPLIARQRGWPAHRIARLLVLPDARTARRQIERHQATFRAALPLQGRPMLAWLRDPSDGRCASGLVFLSLTQAPGRRQPRRVRKSAGLRQPSTDRGPGVAGRPSDPDDDPPDGCARVHAAGNLPVTHTASTGWNRPVVPAVIGRVSLASSLA